MIADRVGVGTAAGARLRARKVLLVNIIDLTVTRRRWMSTLPTDPIIMRLLGLHEPFRDAPRGDRPVGDQTAGHRGRRPDPAHDVDQPDAPDARSVAGPMPSRTGAGPTGYCPTNEG
jgi:hypothetical protein